MGRPRCEHTAHQHPSAQQRHFVGDGMTTATIQRRREGDLAMTNATVPALDDRTHRDRIGTLLRYEYRRMTIGAGQPLGMLFMREANVRH